MGSGHFWRQHARPKLIVIGCHIIQIEFALSLGRSAATCGNQLAQVGIRSPIRDPDDEWQRILQVQFSANDQVQVMLFGRRVGADNSRQRIAIGNRQRVIAKLFGLRYQFVGVRRSFEKREIRFAMEFGVHGKA